MPCNPTPKAFYYFHCISFVICFSIFTDCQLSFCKTANVIRYKNWKPKRSGFLSFLFLFSSMFCLIKVFFRQLHFKTVSKSFEVFNLNVAAVPDGARGQLFCRCNKNLRSSHMNGQMSSSLVPPYCQISKNLLNSMRYIYFDRL